MPPPRPSRDRLKSALLAGTLNVLFGYALVTGLGIDLTPERDESVEIFNIAPDPPPPPREQVIPAPVRTSELEGEAAPPNLTARPKEIVAPPPVIPLPPPPVLAAPIPGLGPAPFSGATDRPGPGTSAGGVGAGRGSGGSGEGMGSREEIPLRLLRGDIRDSDYPDHLREAGVTGVVGLRFVVGVNGRVTSCAVTRSSGVPELDALTCRLIVRRFRYRPTINASGRPVPDVVTGEQGWGVNEEGRPYGE